jgi:hypothetical protein
MSLKLLAEIGIDGTGFESGLRRASAYASGQFKTALAGAFSVGAVTALTRKTLEYAGTINDLSARLGVSTDFLQEFRFVARQTGTDLDKLTVFMEKFNDARAEALSGSAQGKKMMQAFSAFGIGATDLAGGRAEDLITNKIAKAFETGDPQKLIGPLRDIGGRSAGELIAGFSEGFAAGRQKARESGAVLTNDVVQQLDEIGDQFAILGTRLLVEWGQIMLGMLGWIQKLRGSVGVTAAGLGAATATWNKRELAAFFLSLGLVRPKDKPLNMQAAADAEAAAFNEFKKELDAAKAAREQRRSIRERTQFSEPSIAPPDANKRRFLGEPDSLTRVGNFLGSSQVSIVQIGEKTNALLTMTNLHLAEIKRKLVATGEITTYPQ